MTPKEILSVLYSFLDNMEDSDENTDTSSSHKLMTSMMIFLRDYKNLQFTTAVALELKAQDKKKLTTTLFALPRLQQIQVVHRGSG